MQDDLDIKISMLLDGELEAQEALKVLNQIKNEPTLRAKWLRYNAVSSAFKEKPAVLPDAGFFDRVSQAVSEEPVVLSPGNIPKKKPLRMPSIAAALAASVAVLAILFWSTIPSSLSTFSNQPSLFSSTQSESPAQVFPVQSQSVRMQAFPRRFNDYLITHNGSSYTAGAQTMMPYARTVSYYSDR